MSRISYNADFSIELRREEWQPISPQSIFQKNQTPFSKIMPISLSLFFYLYLVFIFFYVLFSFFNMYHLIRFSPPSITVYLVIGLYIIGSMAIFAIIFLFLGQIDWTYSFSMQPEI